MADQDNEYFLAPQDQRVFGAGIKRKRITFVPASSTEDAIGSAPVRVGQAKSPGDRYLAIVLKEGQRPKDGVDDADTVEIPQLSVSETPDAICPVCNFPLDPSSSDGHGAPTTHESSITHQLCLTHSYPPSHLPREHVGLKYLSSYGWDPDSRVGLGARSEGIRVPVKAKAKNDTVGLGIDLEEEKKIAAVSKLAEGESTVQRLNAKQVRKLDVEARKRAEKLRQKFYGPDLEQYLGTGR